MKTKCLRFAAIAKWTGLLLVAYGLFVPSRTNAVGTWTSLINAPAGTLMEDIMLLSDGTVMAQYETSWYQLIPDIHGSYTNGGWKQVASMHYDRNAYGLELLRDGRFLVVGDENDGNGTTAEVYDPVANVWTVTAQATVGFGDCETAMLPDGRVLVAPVGWLPHPADIMAIYDPVADAWSYPGSSLVYQDEDSWVKLPDDSILTIDFYTNTTSERFIPTIGQSGQWVKDADVPVAMFSNGEMGAGMLLPDGRAFFLGGTGHTVLYTPSPLGGTNFGSWAQGPDIPASRVTADAPAGMLVNGKVLCAVGSSAQNGGSPPPTWFYEYDYTDHTAGPNGTFHATSSPWNSMIGSSYNRQSNGFTFLALPDGTILCSSYEGVLYIYQPDTGPLTAGKPTISSITANVLGVSYHLTGTKLNGISAGGAYGDERQAASNYPLVRMTNSAGGNVYYARTFNWSSTGVMTGNTPVTTEFTVPGNVPSGDYSLVVVANGNPSDPVSFTYNGPVWVDFNYIGLFQVGTFDFPFPTLAQGINAVSTGGTIALKPGLSQETMTISKSMIITAVGGPATISH
jgi:hypothetical protein